MKYNLNKIPIKENILIMDHGHNIFGNGKPYASKILESLTWLEICKIANDLIITTASRQRYHTSRYGTSFLGSYRLFLVSTSNDITDIFTIYLVNVHCWYSLMSDVSIDIAAVTAQQNKKRQSSLLSYFSTDTPSKKKRFEDKAPEGVVLEHELEPNVEDVSGSSYAQSTATT
ncbi:hypothetical protein QTP88_027078 [Uroleucon formosanum]